MSVVRGYGLNGKSLYTNVAKPMYTWANFTVTPTNGLGVTSVKSNGFLNYVFMHTSTTPTATGGVTNPNPAAGYAMVGFTNNFNKFLGMRWQVDAPATSTTTASTVIGSVYTITLVGTTTAAQWQAVGLPPWLTATVGQTFVATATQAIGGTGTVGVPGKSNINSVEVVGNPDTTIASSNISTYGGAYLLLQFSDVSVAGTVAAPVLTMDSYTPAGTNNGASPPIFAGTPAVLTGTNTAPAFTGTTSDAVAAPTTGSIIRLELCFDGSSVNIDGI